MKKREVIGETFGELLVLDDFQVQKNNRSRRYLKCKCSCGAETIKEKVFFTGFIHNSKMPQIHAMSDIAVIPSIYDDPAPLVVMECMASGLPIITTDSGGIPEYIGNDNCICVKRDNNIIKNLEIALDSLITNDEYRKNLGQKAQQYAQQFNKERFYNDFINIINK